MLIRSTSFRRFCGLAGSVLGIFVAAGLTVTSASMATAQVALPPAVEEEGGEVGVVWQGLPGITETVDEIMAREAMEPPVVGLRLTDKPPRAGFNRAFLAQNPDSPEVSSWPVFEAAPEPGFGARAPQTIGVEFLAMDDGESGFIPPDTIGDAGLTQLLVCANGRIKVFSKTGVLGGLNASLNTFFNSVRGGSGTADPRVVFDRLTNRWFIAAINTSTPNRILLAVSSGPTITGTGSFTFFQFQQDLVGTTPNADTGAFADYPSLGVDNNAVYIGCNMFSGGVGSGTTGWVVNKANLIGGTLTVTAFRQMAGATGSGPYSPRGVTNDDPDATTGYFIGADNGSFGRLTLRRISTPGGTPTISGNIIVIVPSTTNPLAVPAQGSTVNIEPTNDRLFDARIRRDATTDIRSLWTAHAIQVNSSGVASNSGGRNGARWYQLRNYTTTPVLVQSGTLFDSSASAPDYYIYPTVAASGQGHMALGASVGATDRFMSAATAGRHRTDALGTIQAPLVFEDGVAAYTVTFGGTRNRWGDYSATVVDPTDDMTIWTIQEYCNGTNSWALRVAELKAPPPATPVSCSPNSVAQGASNVNIVVTGTSTANSAFFDPEASFPNHIAASVSGSGVTVNSVTVTSDTQVTLNVSVAANATTNARNITITNPDGQSLTGNGLLTVNAGCTPAGVAIQPNPAEVCEGAGASFVIFGNGTGPLSYQWRRNTVNISGAQSNSLILSSTTPADAGSYDCVVSNACGSVASNAVALVVNAGPSFSQHPSVQNVCAGAPASFSVVASGAGTLSYQWRRDGADISGATASTYSIASASAANAGSYDCVVTGSCGSTTSNAASLTVSSGPVIGTGPAAQSVCEGAPASFSVAATGSGTLSYQWRRNGAPISGAILSIYSIASAGAGDVGSYDCIVSNLCGSVTSGAAALTLGTGPSITTPPDSLLGCLRHPAVFTVVAAGSEPLSYQWRFNGNDIDGATASTYTIPSLVMANEGAYTCRVSNACGDAVSPPGMVVICPADWDCDGDIDSDDIVLFFGDWDTGNGDFDGDDDSDSEDVIGFFGRWENGC